MILTVSPDGTGDFTTIQAAVDAAPRAGRAPVIIRVGKGEYREKVRITKDNLRIVGDGADCTTLTWSDHAKQTFPDGTEKGTFLSYTLIITGNDVEVENLAIRNDAGPGSIVGQAVAVYAAGDRGVFRNCALTANQDTLFCGPTMEKVARDALPYVMPVHTESVGDATYTTHRQYFEDCTIQGDVDFIFGPYRCWFERCTLICNDRGSDVNGYYTAANTPIDQLHGFVFHRCHLTGAGCADSTVYLGRPWRAYARTVFLDCRMDACVKPEGWQDWAEKPVTWRYAEHGTTGARADTAPRHPGAAVLTDAEAAAITPLEVIGGTDGWYPANPARTIYIAGDSTAADYPQGQYPMTGWGQVLPVLLPGVHVVNQARCGRSSKSFVDEKRLAHMEKCMRPGDLLLIQFGHNDEKDDVERHTDAGSTYGTYLTMYVDAARAKGAVPVLLTPIVRRRFEAGVLVDTHGDYPNAMRALAARLRVPLIDLEEETHKAIAALGEAESPRWYTHVPAGHRNYPDGAADDTHLHFDGAYAVAEMTTKGISALRLL